MNLRVCGVYPFVHPSWPRLWRERARRGREAAARAHTVVWRVIERGAMVWSVCGARDATLMEINLCMSMSCAIAVECGLSYRLYWCVCVCVCVKALCH